MSDLPIDNQLIMLMEFGIRRENEERRDGGCGVVFDPLSQRYAVGKREDGRLLFFSGGVSDAEGIEAGVCREVTEESGLHDFLYIEKIAEALAHYYNSAKKVNRVAHATCFLIILRTAHTLPVAHEAHEQFDLVWATAEEIQKNIEERNQDRGHDHWIYFFTKSVARARELGYDTTSSL